ncbi:SRPBCC family protein [Microbacterium pumilum]|uniref:Activator of Hsp90 ATPase homologue 1/2-like C-terminal domain-containing protein n=1 Tax=Microbacterium pumilum TaxID=344165 RepID=A0ABN2SFI7_9MICO
MNAEDPFVRALTGDDEEQTVTLVRHYRAPLAAVWSALTTPSRIARWYGTITGPEPRAVGDRFAVDIGGGMVRQAQIAACDAPTALSYTWWSGDHDPGLVQLRLEQVGDAETRLSVQHDRLRPHRTVQYGAGWEKNLVALADVVGAPVGESEGAAVGARRWEMLRERPLQVALSIEAPVARVWAAWSTGEALAGWWWNHWDDVTIDADVRPGGGYRIVAERHGIAVSGEYLVVDPEHRIAFTWIWTDDDGASSDEAVDVTFRERAGVTDVVVRHTGPWDSDAPADSYRQGWEFVLAELSRKVV